MIVLCTGMIRSGSTWSFNVVKRLLGRISTSVYGEYSDAVGESLLRHGDGYEHRVIKCHAPDLFGRMLIRQRACRTIYTYRDPLESMLSGGVALEKDFETLADLVKQSLDLFGYELACGGVHFIWYEDLVGRSHARVRSIAEYLDLGLDDAAITEVAEMLTHDNVRKIIKNLGQSAKQFSSGSAKWDLTTWFNDRHISNNTARPADVFADRQIAQVGAQLHPYVDERAQLRDALRRVGVLETLHEA